MARKKLVDWKDVQDLIIVQHDGRITSTELSKRIELTESPIFTRQVINNFGYAKCPHILINNLRYAFCPHILCKTYSCVMHFVHMSYAKCPHIDL